MEIPRIDSMVVRSIISNKDLTIKKAAQAIHDYDYKMSQKGSTRRVYRGDLTSTKFIREELKKWNCNNNMTN